MFVNGKGVSVDDSRAIDLSTEMYMGYDGRQSNTWLNGTLSDFCIFRDEAKWTADFTPPTSRLANNKVLYLDSKNQVWAVI